MKAENDGTGLIEAAKASCLALELQHSAATCTVIRCHSMLPVALLLDKHDVAHLIHHHASACVESSCQWATKYAADPGLMAL